MSVIHCPLFTIHSHWCAAAIVLSLVCPLSVSAAAFTDTGLSWYDPEIAALRLRGIIQGYPDGTFKPKNVVNRAELVKTVMGDRSGDARVRRRCFPDVAPRLWFAAVVCEAKQQRIISGYEGGGFRPNAPVNIAEALKILFRAERIPFPDVSGEEWYLQYVEYAHEHGILSKYAYVPWEPLTRERMASIVERTLRLKETSRDGNLSPGCASPSGAGEPNVVTVRGVERSFLLSVPPVADNGEPRALIVAFHGRTNSNAMVRGYFGLDHAFPEYFIAYPSATARADGTFTWVDPGDQQDAPRDLELFDTLVHTIGDRYCIDYHRIYVVGHSLGAWFANTIACLRGGVVRGSVGVAGSASFAPCAGPTASMILHNRDDQLAPFSGSEFARDQRLTQNRCSTETAPAEPESFKCVQYTQCTEGSPVVWCPHEFRDGRNGTNNPHLWPDGTAGHIRAFFEGLPD
ncbi:MAG: S-layer homology domain-containing protein [Candidatus Peregrinibacteria bacterium]|nr:S-layer homology domain-containing protein [Candidatus Peregrinibacteria bacterium]